MHEPVAALPAIRLQLSFLFAAANTIAQRGYVNCDVV